MDVEGLQIPESELLNDAGMCRRAQERADVEEAFDVLYAEDDWFELVDEAAERGMLNARPDSPDNPLTPG